MPPGAYGNQRTVKTIVYRTNRPIEPVSDYGPWMDLALAQARLAEEAGEVPVGAVLIAGGEVVAAAHNSPVRLHDPTAHAEMLVLREACANAANYRLADATLIVTLEPCVMCAGALVNARVARLVFGCRDLRFGGVRSKFQLADSDVLNHRVEIVEGVRGVECTALIKGFFKSKRDGGAGRDRTDE